MEHNPYFWWVDTEGRQLPYIDRVTFELVTDREVINLKASAELDFQFRHLSPTNLTLFKENEERGTVFLLGTDRMGREYSLFDYGFTFTGFIGLARPNFLLAPAQRSPERADRGHQPVADPAGVRGDRHGAGLQIPRRRPARRRRPLPLVPRHHVDGALAGRS